MANNKVMTLDALESKLGCKLEKTRRTSNTNLSEKAQIMRKVNQIVHEALCNEFGEFYKEIETHAISTNKDGTNAIENVKGYRLLIPKKDIKVGNETHEGFAIGKPTIYLEGINTKDCIYFSEIGKTRTNK